MQHNKYEVLGIVGEGAYGIVYKCKYKETNEYVAIKKFKETNDDLVKKTMKRELRMLQQLDHPNCVEFKEAFKRKGNLFLVFEFVDKNLLEYLEDHPKGLDPKVIRIFIYQLCKAIHYLHSKNIIHRDVKPENLLVNSKMELKLCDFGFARLIKSTQNEQLTDYVATRWYRAPELLLTQGNYGTEVDYWAIGCIMGELVDGNPLFPGENELDQLHCIQKVMGNFSEEQVELFYSNPLFNGKKLLNVEKPETLEKRYYGKLNKVAISFMKGLLALEPGKRLCGDKVFSHPYFESLVEGDVVLKVKNGINLGGNDNNNGVTHQKNVQSDYPKKKEDKKESTINDKKNSPTNITNINIINFNNYSGNSNTRTNLNNINNNNANNSNNANSNINSNKNSELSTNLVNNNIINLNSNNSSNNKIKIQKIKLHNNPSNQSNQNTSNLLPSQNSPNPIPPSNTPNPFMNPSNNAPQEHPIIRNDLYTSSTFNPQESKNVNLISMATNNLNFGIENAYKTFYQKNKENSSANNISYNNGNANHHSNINNINLENNMNSNSNIRGLIFNNNCTNNIGNSSKYGNFYQGNNIEEETYEKYQQINNNEKKKNKYKGNQYYKQGKHQEHSSEKKYYKANNSPNSNYYGKYNNSKGIHLPVIPNGTVYNGGNNNVGFKKYNYY